MDKNQSWGHDGKELHAYLNHWKGVNLNALQTVSAAGEEVSVWGRGLRPVLCGHCYG